MATRNNASASRNKEGTSMVDKVNLKSFIQYFKTLEESDYDQAVARHPCGSPACILGHGQEFFKDEVPLKRGLRGCLGITTKQGDDLFHSHPFGLVFEPTLKDAIATLENLLETGNVEWKRG